MRCLGRSKQFVWSMQGIKRAMKPSRSRYVASLGQRWRWMAGSAKVTDKQPGSELLPPTTRAIGTDTHSFSNTCNVVCPAWGRPFTESIDWYKNHHLNHSFRGIVLRKITVVINWRATLNVANMSFFWGKGHVGCLRTSPPLFVCNGYQLCRPPPTDSRRNIKLPYCVWHKSDATM